MSSHSTYNLFVFGVCSFVLGIGVYSFLGTSIVTFFLGLVFSLIAIFLYTAITKKHSTYVYIFFVFCFLCGSFRLYTTIEKNVSFNHSTDVVIGKVISNPKDTIYGQSFEVRTEKATVLLRSSSQSKFLYDDVVSFSPKCESPENFTTAVGTEFDYRSYLRKSHILSICKSSAVSLKERPKFSFKKMLYGFSNNLIDKMNSLFEAPENGIISGMLLGSRTSISDDIQKDFTKTGTIHLLALSGYNIALVAFFFQKIFELFVRRKYALFLSMFSVITFVLMTGASASAIRAGGMIFILILGKLLYKEYSSLRALFIVGAVMIFIEPYTLLYDVSFHLSFLATFGIIVVEPILRSVLWFLKFKAIIVLFSVSLAAQVMTLPYVLYAFNSLSVSSFITNSIVAPFVPIIMFLGTASLVLGSIYIPLALPLIFLTESLVSYMLLLIHYFAQVKNGFFVFNSVPLSLIVFIYVIILIFVFKYYFLQHKLAKKSKEVDL